MSALRSSFSSISHVVLAMLAGLLLCLAVTAHAQEEPLPPEQAFAMTASLLDEKTVEVRFNIAPGYYLYLNKFGFALDPGGPVKETPQYPAGEAHEDKFFGKQTIFRNAIVIRLPLSTPVSTRGDKPPRIIVTAQGCTERLGVCYPPNDFAADLKLANMSVISSAKSNLLIGGADTQTQMDRPADNAATATPAAPAVTADDDDTESITDLLHAGRAIPVILSFFGFGLLLAFTPCMLPMIPILSSIIVGHGEQISRARALRLSSAYVLGMALTYALAGVAAGLSGTLLSTWLQNIWVLGAFAAIFVVLALAMFGLFTLQLPAGMQARLSSMANRQKGSISGVAVMGALSALIVGPCMAAPLAGTLLFIAQTGNGTLGGTALFAMALGMGAPLVAVGVMARHWLPRPGPWMDGVKQFFGVVLLGTALWLVAPMLRPVVAWSLVAILIAIAAALLWRTARSLQQGKARRLVTAVAAMVLATSVAVLAAGITRSASNAAIAEGPAFAAVRSIAELDRVLASSAKPVMLDFYADWCVSCREMEHYTFSDTRVASQLASFTLLRADVTANTAEDRALLKRFGLFGPPGIIFFDAAGQELKGVRVIGYQRAEHFSELLARVKAPVAQ